MKNILFILFSFLFIVGCAVNNQNETKETDEIIKDGWLHTGDIGEITEDGNLKITDRKKEIIQRKKDINLEIVPPVFFIFLLMIL